jgi:hypothetical protein
MTAPAVSSLAPNTGDVTGGASVTITGSNFTGATAVAFGTLAAASFTVVSSTSITAVVPAVPNFITGVVDVRVTTPSGTSAIGSGDKFTYTSPTLSEILVAINGVSAHVVANASALTALQTSVTANASALTALQTSVGEVLTEDTAIVSDLVPTVISLTGPEGLTGSEALWTGGSVQNGLPSFSIVITGTGFANATAVNFGSLSAEYTIDSDTQITATVPAVPVADWPSFIGPSVYVTVTNPVGVSAHNPQANQFSYQAVGVVTSVAPSSGSVAGGESVVITGIMFQGYSGGVGGVNFGNILAGPGSLPATSFTVDSSTQVTAVAPPATAGVVDVRVVLGGGAWSAITPADQFTYE